MQSGVFHDLKRAIANDDCAQLEEILRSDRLSRRPDRVDLVFEELRGRSCLHR